MDIRTRRRKRIAIILVVALVIAGAVGGLILLQQWKRQRQNNHLRITGLEAYEQGDYATAAQNLGRFLRHDNEDTEALYAYSKASLEVPQPGSRHVRDALGALNQVYELEPDHPEAGHDLLLLRTLVGQNEEALELANDLLEKDPHDTSAMGSKAMILMRLEQPEDALAVTEQALEIDPGLYQMNLLRIQLRHRLNEPVDELLANARELQAANPDDARYEMLLGYTHALADQNDEARKWLTSAAGRELPDDDFAATLLNVLDTAQMYPQSLDLLRRAGQREDWDHLRTEMARRLFEHQQYQELVDRLGDLDAASANVEDLALLTMALYELDQREQADELRTALADRKESAHAPLWASVLAEVYAPEPQARQIIAACLEAVELAPANGYFHAYLGNAYANNSDQDLALASWRQAAQHRPSWAQVRGQIAHVMLSRRQADEAIRLARDAYLRQPNRISNIVTYVRARAMNIDDYTGSEARETLRLIDQVQQGAPGEPQTRALRVSILANMDRKDEAAAELLTILDEDTQLGQAYWLLLAEVSRQHDLGLEGRLLGRVEEQSGNTAELALTRATELAREGQPQQGLALIEAGYESASPQHRNQWQLVRAMFLDILDDERSRNAWAELVETQPENLRALQLALRASTVQADRELTARILDLLHQQMGESSVVWRTERARFLLDSPEVERDSAAAVTLLRQIVSDTPGRVEPRLMLARGLEQLGRTSLAISELRSADQAVPNRTEIHLQLARLLQADRQFSAARNYIDQIAHNPDASNDDRRAVADLLAQQGDDRQAIELLEELHENAPTTDDRDRVKLALLYHRNGQSDKARDVLETALQDPTPATLAFALEFYESRDQPQQVQRILTLLENSGISDSERQQILGGFYARTGKADQAISLYRQRATDDPQSLRAWTQLIALHLAAGDADQALRTAEQALTHLPDAAALNRVTQHEQVIRQTIQIEGAKPLLVTLVADPRHGDAAAQALKLIARAAASTPFDAAELAQQVGQLADQNRDMLSLQTVAGRLYLQARQPEQAADIASRASRSFPRAAEPTWIHAQALAQQERWLDVLGAAAEWRSRTLESGMQGPDLLMAEAHLNLGDPTRALRAMEPYVQPALAAPAEHAAVVSRYVRALVAQKRYDQAGQVLLPLTAQDLAWRKLAMDLASGQIDAGPVASTWLAQVAQQIPENATGEQVALARAHWQLGQRLNDSQFLARARQVMTQATERGDAPAGAWYMRGVMAEQAGDLDDAETSYRAAIEANAQLPVARNNLAMVLVQRGDSDSTLDEAMQLAESAVEAEPRNTFFLDTLATVQAKAGQVEKAIESLNRAIELDPGNDTWKRNLAKILQDSGREEEAQKILDQLQRSAGRA